MSYDLYLWHMAQGDIDEILDSLAEGDASDLVPAESVGAFRRELLTKWPQLTDVIEPEPDDGTDAGMRYVVLTLPYGWLDLLEPVVKLATAHGLSGWDPQDDAPVARRTGSPKRTPPAVSGREVDGVWTVAHLSGLGVGARAIGRAWALGGLPDQVSFGQAVGVFILAMAMRDGVEVSAEAARHAIEDVAARCAQGVPKEPSTVSIGYCMTDVPGFAATVARGHF